MKKILPIILILFLIKVAIYSQTTATDFTLTDCAGNSHSLFAELDAGKVVVISFVMPCASCIGPSVSTFDVVASYNISYPGRVKFLLSDDNGNTSCTSLNTWASQNGMTNAAIISNSGLQMSQYNGNGLGMPKIVVLGGANHTVYYNENNGDNAHNLDAAINQALGATGLIESENSISNFNVFPNPVKRSAMFSYTLSKATDVSLEIVNILGEKLKTTISEKQETGKYNTQIDFENFIDGIYFIKLNTSSSSEIVKFIVAH